MKKHPGFKKVSEAIAKKENISPGPANAILANATRHASKAARKENPNLNKVKR